MLVKVDYPHFIGSFSTVVSVYELLCQLLNKFIKLRCLSPLNINT